MKLKLAQIFMWVGISERFQGQTECCNMEAYATSVTQLLEYNLDWNFALNSGIAIDVIYLDYAKAFDSVVHKLSNWYLTV